MAVHASHPAPWRIALAAAAFVACSGGNSKDSKPDARAAAFRDADIYDVPMRQDLPDCPASCDDQNPCTKDFCDPDTHLCRNDPATEGTSCVAADLCTLEAACKSGLCIGTRTRDCTLPPDQCHESGYCLPTTGLCTYATSLDSKRCDDENLCTTGDHCLTGGCQGVPIQCGAGLTCDVKTGQCPGFPTANWGFVLEPSACTAAAIDSSFSDLTMSPSGALYFTASFANKLDLGAGPMSTTSNPSMSDSSFDYNALIARLDPVSGRALWSKNLGDKAVQAGSSIAVNASDIVLVSGAYSGKVELGPVPGVDAGSLILANTSSYPKLFLVAMEGATGKTLWGLSSDISSDGTPASQRTRVAVDPYDNNFVVCASPTALASGLGATRSGGKGDALIVKLNAQTGQFMWGEQFGGTADESCDGVAADGKGKVFITGHLAKGGALDFHNGSTLSGPTAAIQQAAFVQVLDSTAGAGGWGKVFRSDGATSGKINPAAIVTDGKLVWIGGSFTFSASFGQIPTLVSSSGSGDVDSGTSPSQATSAFVAALDATSGDPQWAKNWGSTAVVNTLAINSTGMLFLGGSYLKQMVFDTLAPLGDSNSANKVPFVAKLNGGTGLALTARGYASTVTSTAAFQTFAIDKASSATTHDVPYAIGYLGNAVNGIDLGSPVGTLSAAGSTVDSGTARFEATLFLAKFEP